MYPPELSALTRSTTAHLVALALWAGIGRVVRVALAPLRGRGRVDDGGITADRDAPQVLRFWTTLQAPQTEVIDDRHGASLAHSGVGRQTRGRR